jgi:hypothetical protein
MKRSQLSTPWSQQDIDFLIENYGQILVGEIARVLCKSIGSLYYQLKKLNISRSLRRPWSQEEVKILQDHYVISSASILQEFLPGRSIDSIQLKAAQLGLKNIWTSDQVQLLSSLVRQDLSYQQIASRVGRDISSVHYKLSSLGLTKPKKSWDKVDMERIFCLIKAGATYADIVLALPSYTIVQIRGLCAFKNWDKLVIKNPVSIGEKVLEKFLLETYKSKDILKQFHLGKHLRLDFFVSSRNLGIEYNGKQHYEKIAHFHRSDEAFLRQQERDLEKKYKCDELGISLVSWPYTIQITDHTFQELVIKALNGGGSADLETCKTYGGFRGEWFFKQQERKKQCLEKTRLYRKKQYAKIKAQKKQTKERDLSGTDYRHSGYDSKTQD